MSSSTASWCGIALFFIWIINATLRPSSLRSVFRTVLRIFIFLGAVKIIHRLIQSVSLVHYLRSIYNSNFLVSLGQLSSSLFKLLLLNLLLHSFLIELRFLFSDILFNQLINSLLIDLSLWRLLILFVLRWIWLNKISTFWLHYAVLHVLWGRRLNRLRYLVSVTIYNNALELWLLLISQSL